MAKTDGKVGRPRSLNPSVGTSLKMTQMLAEKLDSYVQAEINRGIFISKSSVIQLALVEFLERHEAAMKRQ